MREQLLERLADHGELPEYPQLLNRLEEMMEDPEASFGEIGKLVSSDPVLVGRLLKIANSAFYGSGRKEVTNVPEALQRLGLREVRKIAYSVEVSTLFRDTRLIDQHAFWQHSLAVALFSQNLQKYVSTTPELQNQCYISGLFHDIGLIVYATLIPDEYGRFLSEIADKEVALHVQEREWFGMDHAELGSEFIRLHWLNDPVILNTVKQHHLPFLADEKTQTLVQLIHLANAICDSVGIQNGIGVYKAPFEEGAWIRLGLRLEYAEEILASVKEALMHTESLLAS